MQTPNPAAVEAARATLEQLEADRAARPHCKVTGSSMAHALKSLATIFEDVNSGNTVVVAFDGQLLSFDCNGLKTVVVATGIAWPSRYQLAMAAIADVLPIRLKHPEVEVGIWKSMLEINHVRCPGVRKAE
jgi:hypothetical protein